MNRSANSPPISAPHWKRSLLRILGCAIFALAMTSCATGTEATKADPPRLPPPPPPPDVQANQRQPCPPLPLLIDDRALSFIANHDQTAAQYHDCSARGDSLLQSIDEWRATAWRWYCQAAVASGLRVTDCPAEVK